MPKVPVGVDPRVDAAARVMREQAADPTCRSHQVDWGDLPEARRTLWRDRATAVLAAAAAAR